VSSQVSRILGDLVRVPGVLAVFVVSKEGFVVDKAETGTLEIDEDAVAAMTVTVLGSAEQLGGELNIGKPEILTLEYRGNIVLLHDLGEHLLALLADKSKAVLGRLRYEVKKQAPRIRDAL